MKILLDTDIGTDVDDAVCLAYLLAQPECELLGITTVTGQATLRASLASAICRHAGKEIPIYPGADQPMVGVQRQPVAQQAAALPKWPHETDFPQGKAIEFLYETICKHPGEVTLLTIGPLTNAGQLFLDHPDTAPLLKGFVMMGGLFNGEDGPEWNAAGDPVASEIVYRAPVKLHRSVGLDVTQQVMLPADEVRRQFTAPILRPVLDYAEIWFEQFYPAITFHDPLAAATIFEPSLCAYQPGTVILDREQVPGRTLWNPGGVGAPHEVATGVDPERYFEHFFRVVNRAEGGERR